MYRIDRTKWHGIFYRSFLVNKSHDKIYGQFISSSWFSINLEQKASTIEFVVVEIHGENEITISPDLIYSALTFAEENNQALTDIGYVVVHERFDINKIKTHLNELLFVHSNQTNISYQEQRPLFGATFRLSRDKENNFTYTISCPMFTKKLI
jgi:hypothetical protein